MCFCVAVFVDDWCLNVMLGYVAIDYVKMVCVVVLSCLLLMGMLN